MFSAFLGNNAADEPWVLDRVAATLEEIEVREGEVLYRRGDPSTHLFFMIDGRMRLTDPGRPDWVYEGRWVMSTTDLLVGRPRARTVTSERDTRMFRVHGALWVELLEDSFEITSNALLGNARGTSALYARLPPTGGFAPPDEEPPDCDTDNLVGRAILLATLPPLKNASVQALTDLAATARRDVLESGALLFEAGAPRDRIYVVEQGSVELTRREPDLRAVFKRGSIVGDALALAPQERAYAARTLERSSLLSFSIEELFNQMEEHPEMGRGAMAALSLERERLYDLIAARDGELVLG